MEKFVSQGNCTIPAVGESRPRRTPARSNDENRLYVCVPSFLRLFYHKEIMPQCDRLRLKMSGNAGESSFPQMHKNAILTIFLRIVLFLTA